MTILTRQLFAGALQGGIALIEILSWRGSWSAFAAEQQI